MPRNQSEARPRGRDALQVLAAVPDTPKSTGDPRQTPVAHLAAEVAVLGAMMQSDRAREAVPSMLAPDDFDREATEPSTRPSSR
jgi:hypothetical protein